MEVGVEVDGNAAAGGLGHAEVLIGVAARVFALLLVFDALVLLVPHPVALGTGKARIALAQVRVGNVAIDLVVLQVLEIGLAVKPGVGSYPDPLQDVLIASQRLEALSRTPSSTGASRLCSWPCPNASLCTTIWCLASTTAMPS